MEHGAAAWATAAIMCTLIDPPMQQSEKAGEESASALAVAKHFQGCWLQVHCQATTGLNLLLCMKLPDLAQRHHPLPHIVFLTDCKSAVQSLQSPRKQLERETQSDNAFFVTCHNTARLLSIGSLLTVGSQEMKGGSSCQVWQRTRAAQPGNLLWRGQRSDQAAFWPEVDAST